MKRILLYIEIIVVCITLLSCKSNINKNEFLSEQLLIEKNRDLYGAISSYPFVDGSTANIPLMAQIMSDYTGITIDDAKNFSQDISTTDYAWEKLITDNDKSIDADNFLIIAYEPSEFVKKNMSYAFSDQERLNGYYKKIKIVPIGVDGFVFLRNKNNKVDNLSIKDIQDIYSDKKKNWKDFGGSDINIEAYQRAYNSGSQTLFTKLVMKDVKPTKAKKEYELGDMGGVFSTLSRYDNTANAIGYSVFYYADKMLDYPNLDFFKVNGVYPSDETIESGEYSLTNAFYMAIREDAKEDSPSYKLYNWILSEEGQKSIRKAGYIPVKEQKEFQLFE